VNKTVLAIDSGYGDNKVVFGDSSGIKNIYKFPSVAGSIVLNELVSDDRVLTFNDRNFYIGQDALSLPSKSIIDIDSYEKLEYFAPLFVARVLGDLKVVPDIIVIGLSIAQIKNSGHYKKLIEDFLRKSGIGSTIHVVPQGAVAKLAVDKYGVDFPEDTKDFNSSSSYILADIGFNTLDICHVVNGTTSANLVRGIEKMGATLIVNDLIISIRDTHNILLNPSECKDVLATGLLKRRGVQYDVAALITKAKSDYIGNLRVVIENEFGDVLDKVDSLVLVGGGSYILGASDNNFIKSPRNKAEFYNAIGYYLFGVKQS